MPQRIAQATLHNPIPGTGEIWKVTMAQAKVADADPGTPGVNVARIGILVTEELPVPDVAALQTPSGRIGEYVEE